MDSSGSIGDIDWVVAKQFVSDVTSTFPVIGPAGTLVSYFIYLSPYKCISIFSHCLKSIVCVYCKVFGFSLF